MAKIKIPKGLPKCAFLEVLARKAEARQDTDFDFLGELNRFRKRVSEEVRQINVLFREYTPHEEEYHLKHLFHVADTLLGRERFEEMNSAELFMLAVSLYGHDWGMAVSEPEKEYILTGKPPEGTNAEDLWILPNERQRFADFARKEGLPTDEEGHVQEIAIEDWREYVRQTHAFRSGERVRRYFEAASGGVADAGCRICEGHWLEFEDLQSPDGYPTNYSLLNETANLRALSVYLRLIDLLDLAEDRTPYVIWKFVAPRDSRSKMEWQKHRVLRPVTCPAYQQGRIIQVDGSTDDHEVYAALEDLKIWCEQQLRGCNDVLARMNDRRHKLDLYHIGWRVAPRGFEPVSIQFEFNREKMFEILSDEIYQGDPYVFLRELLQNSIDAIRMRRELLERKGIPPGDLGVIRVDVEHGENGDAVVTWRDDGIGMDEYVVRNYLAVAGKSYYQSTDFERLGLEMDPISRFGIGILSCFMVAERIEIETYKDPYLPPPARPLKIVIPAVRRQFRIESIPQEGSQVGTTVRVFVDGKKLPCGEGKAPRALEVARYLSIVAGFVQFPIAIAEGDRRIVVVHAMQDPGTAIRRAGEGFEVAQLDLDYPWSEVFASQDVTTAREFLREERYDLAADLGLDGYEGAIACVVPADQGTDLARDGSRERRLRVVRRAHGERSARLIRWSRQWKDYGHGKRGLGLTSGHGTAYAVYRDGILLATVAGPEPHWRSTVREVLGALPSPRIVVNLAAARAPTIDLARTRPVADPEPWDRPLFDAYVRRLLVGRADHLAGLGPEDRLYEMGRISAFYDIDPVEMWEFIPEDLWPVVLLDPGGGLCIVDYEAVRSDPIEVCPEWGGMYEEIVKLAACHWLTHDKYRGPLTEWVGARSLVRELGFWGSHPSIAIYRAAQLSEFAMTKNHRLGAVRFLVPPWEGDPPLPQQIWVPLEVNAARSEIEKALAKATDSADMLDAHEMAFLNEWLSSHGFPPAVEFPEPFRDRFAYSMNLLNIGHPAARALLRFLAALEIARQRDTLRESQLGEASDAVEAVLTRTFPEELWYLEWQPWSADLERLWRLAKRLHLCELGAVEDLVPSPDEFVPGTVVVEDRDEHLHPFALSLRAVDNIRPFGRPLS